MSHLFLDGFVDLFRAGVHVSEAFIRALDARGVTAQRIDTGTNIFRLPLAGVDVTRMKKTLEGRGIEIATPAAGATALTVNVNESWARRPAEALASDVLRAMGRAS